MDLNTGESVSEQHVFKTEEEKAAYEKEMYDLYIAYKPLLDAASEQDMIDLAGATPLDYNGEWAKLFKELTRKSTEIRRKYGAKL